MAGATNPPSRRLLVISAITLIALLALLLVGGLGGSRQPSETPTGPQARAPHQPRREETGVDVGFPRGREGAVAAAVAYATASQRLLYMSDDEIADVVRAIATAEAADGLADLLVEEVSTAREGLSESPGPVWWLVRPLAHALRTYGETLASVEVWVVTVLSAREVAAPQAEWRTVDVEVVWADDDWKLDAIHETPGPTPTAGPGDRPWDAIPFDDALHGFERLDGEAVR